jgi:hypothetical protein
MKLNDIYTPIEDVRREIYQRWSNQILRQNVESFFGGAFTGMGAEPYAVLCRTLATPNREFFCFAEHAAAIGLTPLAQEYLDDRFCTLNPDKLSLIRITILSGTDHQNRPNFRRYSIAENNKVRGSRFSAIKSSWGENLVDFHHRLFEQFFPNINYTNESAWIHKNGTTAKSYYFAHLIRFICHGVLFENFLETRNELAFTRDVVLPAFEAVHSRFGVKPIIVRLMPDELAEDPSWSWYEKEIEPLVTKHLPRS